MSAHPNLLFIYTDEQRFDTLRCYGNAAIEMPNLNRLADSSTVFDRAYVTQPVCTPSRASLLTGLTPHSAAMTTNNLTLPDHVRCLPEYLPDSYRCAHLGKWHLGDEIFPQHGFDEWISTEDTYHAFYREDRDQAARSDYHHWLLAHGQKPFPNDLPPIIGDRFFRDQIARMPEELNRSAFLASEATRFLHANKDHPFALYVNFLEPHMPFFSCRDNQYDPADVTVPDNFMHPMDERYSRRARRKAEMYRTKGYGIDRPLATEEQWRALIARYWGMCSLIDTHIGTILSTLESLGLDSNTVVVFTSDHGDMMSSHGLLGKSQLFEEASRVPLLVRLPGQNEQKRIQGPASQIDLVPTILESMGVEVPEGLEGTSRLEAVRKGSPGLGEGVFIEWHGAGIGRQPQPHNLPPEFMPKPKAPDPIESESIRTVVTSDNWKLNVSSIGDHELFNLNDDPCECDNVVARPENRGRIDDMLSRIHEWQKRTSDNAEWEIDV